MNGTDEISERVLLELGKMRRELPRADEDVEFRLTMRNAGRDFVDSVSGDQRAARFVMVCDALGLDVEPGSTRQLAAEAFIRKR